MQVLHRQHGYLQDPTRYMHFEDYASKCGDFVLVQGGFVQPTSWKEYGLSGKKLEKIKKKRIVRLEFEEPNKYFVADHPEVYDHEFYKVFTICPYTAEWLNKKYGENKNIPIFFPISERYIPKSTKKTIDIIYSGHILSQELKYELYSLKQFNYAVVSNSKDKIVNYRSASYEDKMKLYSKSKITLVHNLFYKQYIHRIINVWLSGDFWNNKAFQEIPLPWKPWGLLKRNMYVPQLKSRVFEAAVSRSLILCRRDNFNVIEQYFEPNKEFVYYDAGKLIPTIEKILKNFDQYNVIIERAYKRAVNNYTTKAFVNKYLMNIDK